MEKCHFIGIGGIGMSGLASILLGKNIQVSGSDLAPSKITENLANSGANIYFGHSEKYISPEMTVIYNTDIKAENPEYAAALQLKCQMLHRSDLLGVLMQQKRSLAVAGTHGKTTTSSLLAWVLHQAGVEPSYAIGGVIPQLQGNAAYHKGEYFVAEACESDGSFLNYESYGAIVTNIDCDHMDHYKTETALIDAFQKFMGKVNSSEHLFWCGDDQHLIKMGFKNGISYGFGDDCALRAENFCQNGWKVFFDIIFRGKTYTHVEVSLTGKHNALNALAVFGLCLSLGIPEVAIRQGLRSFSGVERRCEVKGDWQNILFLDDYGHHPTEIRATLAAIKKAIQGRRLVVAYQPHRYSRAKECMGMYAKVFDQADELFVTEIYAARETAIAGVSHEQIIGEIQETSPQCRFASRSSIAEILSKFLKPHDVLVTLGAGDITKVGPETLSFLKLKSPPKLKVGVIYGGASVEHAVSLLSSENICQSLNPYIYDVKHFGITRQGQWVSGDHVRETLQEFLKTDGSPQHSEILTPEILENLQACDIFFPILHGPYGEDGTIQGFFDILGKAYVGCDHRSSAVCMDKALTKCLMHLNDIRTSPFVFFNEAQWRENSTKWIQHIQNSLTYPVFVKPTHLGSTIGVKKVESEKELSAAIQQAFRFDTDVLVENGLVGRELEFSLLGNDEITVFPPGEICTNGQIYDYEGKYGTQSTPTEARADVPVDLIEEGMQFVKKAYIAAGCKGMARVDTFLDRNGKYWLNEINPIPGFTKLSLYPQICAANGLATQALVDQLIILGLQRKRTIDKLEKKP